MTQLRKIKCFFVMALIACVLIICASAETFNRTLVRTVVADPWLFTDGEYYYLTRTGTSKIDLLQSDTISDLLYTPLKKYTLYDAAYDPTVAKLYGSDATINGTWSPEIHYFSEEDYPGYSGWYMFLAIRKKANDSSSVRMVVLKSTTDGPEGPYGHPVTGEKYYSQPVLDKDGNIYDEWGCGMSAVRIPEGLYKGIYTMWVAETGRGQGYGNFYQSIMIAKMTNPWTMSSTPSVVTTPTQDWEKVGAGSTHPQVVEGATAVYGVHGEVFLTYSGSGYWSDYGLGQLTWSGGDPLETSSWVKLSDTVTGKFTATNPIFSAVTASDLRGAGHASFITDKEGNGFFCYHAYPYTNGTKGTSRRAYIESYYIDYTEWNGTSYGVIHLGINDNGVAADTSTAVTFALEGGDLTVPTVAATGGSVIMLQMHADNAEGYTIFRSTDGSTFAYLTSVENSIYIDSTVAAGQTYYYRVYSYRAEEISTASDIVSATVPAFDITQSKPAFTATQTTTAITLTWETIDGADGYEIYRKAPGESSYTALTTLYNGNISSYTDSNLASGTRYYYLMYAFCKSSDGTTHLSASSGSKAIFTKPAAPAGSVEYDVSGGIKVSVTVPVTCTGYVYCRSSDGGVSYSPVKTTSSTSFIDTDVEVGTTYYYSVYAYAGDDTVCSDNMIIGSFTACPKAAEITTIFCRSGNVTLTWGSVDAIDGYTIWRKEWGTSLWTALDETTGLTYTDTTADSGVTYVYAVQTCKIVDDARYYSEILPVCKTITVFGGYSAPKTPSGTAEYDISGGIRISITTPVTCTGYVYCRSEDGGISYSVVTITSATSFVDTDVEEGATYCYRVYAYNGNISIRSSSTFVGSCMACPAQQ